jgi:hypothetical protein
MRWSVSPSRRAATGTSSATTDRSTVSQTSKRRACPAALFCATGSRSAGNWIIPPEIRRHLLCFAESSTFVRGYPALGDPETSPMRYRTRLSTILLAEGPSRPKWQGPRTVGCSTAVVMMCSPLFRSANNVPLMARIVGLAAAAGEHDLVGRRAEQRRHLAASQLQCGLCRRARPMAARGIAKGFVHEWPHGGRDRRIDGRAGVVVEINLSHRIRTPAPCRRRW